MSNTIMVGERSSRAVIPDVSKHPGDATIWAGASRTEPMDPENVGRMATFATNYGSAFVLMQTGLPVAQNVMPQPRIGFSSLHAGGSNFLFADGSVHFLSQSIDSQTAGTDSDYLDESQWRTYQWLQIIDDNHSALVF